MVLSCPFLPAESGSNLPSQHSGTTSPDLFDSQPTNVTLSKQNAARKTPESFLGPNAALVNLDSLVSKPPQPVASLNPFLAPGMLQYIPLHHIICFPILSSFLVEAALLLLA